MDALHLLIYLDDPSPWQEFISDLEAGGATCRHISDHPSLVAAAADAGPEDVIVVAQDQIEDEALATLGLPVYGIEELAAEMGGSLVDPFAPPSRAEDSVLDKVDKQLDRLEAVVKDLEAQSKAAT